MQQYFVKGTGENPVLSEDKNTLKHMFSVMRLVEDDEVVLVFEDGIKRLAKLRVKGRHVLNLVKNFSRQRGAAASCDSCFKLP